MTERIVTVAARLSSSPMFWAVLIVAGCAVVDLWH